MFVVPGLAAVAIAGLMDVPLGTYLLYGLPIGLTTALVTTFLFRLLLGRGFWKDETDFDPDVVVEEGAIALGRGEADTARASFTSASQEGERAERLELDDVALLEESPEEILRDPVVRSRRLLMQRDDL